MLLLRRRGLGCSCSPGGWGLGEVLEERQDSKRRWKQGILRRGTSRSQGQGDGTNLVVVGHEVTA